MLALVAVTVFIINKAFDSTTKGAFSSAISFLFLTIFYMIDITCILGGAYGGVIQPEDYIYASMKLFADFVLCFQLILKCMVGGG